MLYVWLGVVVLAVIIEIIVPGLVAIWFVPSALVAMLLEFVSVPPALQTVIFLILSILFIFLFRSVAAKRSKSRTNVNAVIGQKCSVIEKIDNIAGEGRVRLGGMEWAARAENENESFDVGDVVTVVSVEGVKLIVKK